jgi:hypothetical protein
LLNAGRFADNDFAGIVFLNTVNGYVERFEQRGTIQDSRSSNEGGTFGIPEFEIGMDKQIPRRSSGSFGE